MLDPEPSDMYHCPAYCSFEIHIPLLNKSIGSYQIQSLGIFVVVVPKESNADKISIELNA